jgi:hypothetical protein
LKALQSVNNLTAPQALRADVRSFSASSQFEARLSFFLKNPNFLQNIL